MTLTLCSFVSNTYRYWKESLLHIITVTTVWSTGETGDIYPSLHLSTYLYVHLSLYSLFSFYCPSFDSVLIQTRTTLVNSSIFNISNNENKICCIVVTCSRFDCFLSIVCNISKFLIVFAALFVTWAWSTCHSSLTMRWRSIAR